MSAIISIRLNNWKRKERGRKEENQKNTNLPQPLKLLQEDTLVSDIKGHQEVK